MATPDPGADSLLALGVVVSELKTAYMDRLAQSERLESWQPEDLTAALAVVDDLDAARRRADGGAHVLDIRLAIYRRRLQYELHQREDHDDDFGD